MDGLASYPSCHMLTKRQGLESRRLMHRSLAKLKISTSTRQGWADCYTLGHFLSPFS